MPDCGDLGPELRDRVADPERIAAARRVLPDAAGDTRLDRMAELATTILGVPTAAVTLVIEQTTVVSSTGQPHVGIGSSVEIASSLCAMCVETGAPFVVSDTSTLPRAAGVDVVQRGLADCFIAAPMRDQAGHVVGALCAFGPGTREWTQSDVDVMRALAASAIAELELGALGREFDQSRARWNLAVDAAGIGSFDWNLRTGQLLWDDRLIELFGYTDDDRFNESIEDFNARLHPDDVPRVTQALTHAIENVGDYEAEYRVVLPSGVVKQVQARGRAVAGRQGEAVAVLGAAWDVSVTRAAQDRAAAILEAMPEAYLALDTDYRIVFVNRAGETLFRQPRHDLVGRDLAELASSAFLAELHEARGHLDGNRSVVTFEHQVPEMPELWFEIRAVVGTTAGTSTELYISDVSDRHLAQQAEKQMAEHDRAVAVALQRAMLSALPDLAAFDVRARYITAAQQDQVGGDWYDAIGRADGRTTIVVGDVGGHDIDAAGQMGQLRNMLRAFVWEGSSGPAGAAERIDHAMRDLGIPVLATCVIARLDPHPDGTASLSWTNAGNLPPVHVPAGGPVTLLEAEPELLLGVDPAEARHEHVRELAAGDSVIVYTDGLVERRGIDLQVRLDALTESVQQHRALPPAELIDAIVADMVADRPDDDVVILAVRVPD